LKVSGTVVIEFRTPSLRGPELAGSVSALANCSNRVNIRNNSAAAAGLFVFGTHRVVGGIEGSGTTQVTAGSDLTADHIIQGALVIGGTAGSPATVTIAASDASGNPLGQLSARPNGLILAGSLASDGPFAAGIGPPSLLGDTASSGSSFTFPTLGNSNSAFSVGVVPEPSTIVISAFALMSLLGFGIGRRWKRIAFH
jgi:hypothetical protein